jgi:hypothetical protein
MYFCHSYRHENNQPFFLQPSLVFKTDTEKLLRGTMKFRLTFVRKWLYKCLQYKFPAGIENIFRRLHETGGQAGDPCCMLRVT